MIDEGRECMTLSHEFSPSVYLYAGPSTLIDPKLLEAGS